jgi:hypothetical protein
MTEWIAPAIGAQVALGNTSSSSLVAWGRHGCLLFAGEDECRASIVVPAGGKYVSLVADEMDGVHDGHGRRQPCVESGCIYCPDIDQHGLPLHLEDDHA